VSYESRLSRPERCSHPHLNLSKQVQVGIQRINHHCCIQGWNDSRTMSVVAKSPKALLVWKLQPQPAIHSQYLPGNKMRFMGEKQHSLRHRSGGPVAPHRGLPREVICFPSLQSLFFLSFRRKSASASKKSRGPKARSIPAWGNAPGTNSIVKQGLKARPITSISALGCWRQPRFAPGQIGGH